MKGREKNIVNKAKGESSAMTTVRTVTSKAKQTKIF